MLPKSVSNVLCRVSVRTNVPAMNVTPRTMESAVSAKRSLCASSPLMVTRHTSGAQTADALQDGLGCGVTHLVDDVAVGEEDDAVGVGRAAGVVGDHHDRLAELGHRPPQEGQHLGGGVRVEVAGGLVGEDEVGLVDQGPGAGTALLLPARHLGGPVGG